MIATIAIDDEPLALELVESYIRKTPFLELIGTFDNPLSAMEYMQENHVDLVYLDIHMPDLSGTQFAKMLMNGPKVIFTTAYEKYALESYKLDVIDYLLKPFGYEEFLHATLKAKERIQLFHQPQVQIEATNEFLFLKSEYKIRRINFNDIIYIEGLKDYVKVFLTGKEYPLLSLSSLKQLESRLPSDKFMRVHRSFIVNLQRIEIIERNRIVFGQEWIPIGDQYKEEFQKWVDQNFL